MRRLSSITCKDERNSMQHLFETVAFWRVMKNFIVVQMTRYTPFLGMKNWMLRHLLKMQVGRDVSVGLMAMLDIIKPELISIGDNSIIGYNTTILSHEYLLHEFRYGPVEIGANVLIGANCTILAGVSIGDNAVVGAGTVVAKDVQPNTKVVGNPMRVL
jgi:acetyltransferase-like isoleucine patch superfamily enzyme